LLCKKRGTGSYMCAFPFFSHCFFNFFIMGVNRKQKTIFVVMRVNIRACTQQRHAQGTYMNMRVSVPTADIWTQVHDIYLYTRLQQTFWCTSTTHRYSDAHMHKNRWSHTHAQLTFSCIHTHTHQMFSYTHTTYILMTTHTQQQILRCSPAPKRNQKARKEGRPARALWPTQTNWTGQRERRSVGSC
jgi:hypothetical protein